MVVVNARTRYPICYECQKTQLVGDIKDPAMEKMFSIPDEYYQQNMFLRSIKINYLKFGKLTDKQIDAFKKTVEKMSGKAMH